MQPDFLVIGAMKCGTSTVCAYLEDHPEVFMVAGSDPNFFGDDTYFAKGSESYERLFVSANPGMICGEGTNNYAAGALFPDSAPRIHAYRPDMKLVYVLRDPVQRIESAWIQDRAGMGDAVPSTLDRAVTEMPERYVDQSLYWKNLSRYRALFPDTQIWVATMEDMKADQTAFFESLTGFLGVPPFDPARPHLNPSTTKRIPTSAYSLVNKLPLSRTLRRAFPKTLRTAVKTRILSRSAADRPQFSPRVRADLVDMLRDDSHAILAHMGKPANYWKM